MSKENVLAKSKRMAAEASKTFKRAQLLMNKELSGKITKSEKAELALWLEKGKDELTVKLRTARERLLASSKPQA